MEIVKRNNQVVAFDKSNIVQAVVKAMKETEKGIDTQLAEFIADDISEQVKLYKTIPTVEDVQDEVEYLLMDSDRKDVAKTYILYRDKKEKLRVKGWEMTELQKDIYEQKYRLGNESFNEFLERVSGGNQPIKKLIRDKKFMPAGRILAGRGLKEHGRSVTLSNCYVMPKVEDNIESIFDTAKYLARTYSYGGGCGLDISNLRPSGAKVNNSAHTTTGATSFMDLYSLVTGLIGQKGRRGALMINIDVSHPDILDFIDIKNHDVEKVRFANISVNMTKEFMEAVDNDTDFELLFTVAATDEVIKRTIRAKDLFRLLAKNNWNMAEPGILYQDRINSWHIMSEDENFEFAGVNPCAEEPLPPFGSCNLASINLSEFVLDPFTENARFDYVEFDKAVRHGVIYLNEILDYNMDNHPLKEQGKVSEDLRQIGLGIMGLADMFIKMGVEYGSVRSLAISNSISNDMINSAMQQSALMAKVDGTFPLYDSKAVLTSPFVLNNCTEETLVMILEHGLRNSQILTIAPTGSISTMIGVSGGIEPIFQTSYTRKSETLHEGDTYYKVFTPIVKDYMDQNDIKKESDLPDYFVTSSDLQYQDRINVQAAWQKNIDASISSTVNVPFEFTVSDVEELYLYAWKKGLKGVTIYRDGCARGGVLITDKTSNADEITDNCPECGGTLIHSGGCEECQDCAYSACSI